MNAPPQLPDNPARPTLDKIVATPQASPAETAIFYNLETVRLQNEKLNIINQALTRDVEHRNKWANRLFPLCVGWLLAVAVVMGLDGFHPWGFHLDNSVVIAFIGTTTADVLGLGYIVVNYLFPKQQ